MIYSTIPGRRNMYTHTDFGAEEKANAKTQAEKNENDVVRHGQRYQTNSHYYTRSTWIRRKKPLPRMPLLKMDPT